MKKAFCLLFLFFVVCACDGCGRCHVYKDKESHSAGLKQTILKF